MAGVLAMNADPNCKDPEPKNVAGAAVLFADALLAELVKES